MPIFDLANFAELIDYNFNEIKDEIYQSYPREYPSYMKVEQMDRAFDKENYLSGLTVPQKNKDAQPIPFDDPVLGFTSVFVPTNYRLGYQIDRTSVEDEKWGLLADRPRTMLRGATVIQDTVAADLFNNGFTAQSYDLGPTGNIQPLFSATIPREDGEATWSNLINQTLPITVETVFMAINNLLMLLDDSRGLPITYNGTFYIYVPLTSSTKYQQAVEVINSVMNPNTADNRINAATTAFSIQAVPLRYLTNPDAWFVGWAPSSPNYGLVFKERVAPDISALQPFGNNIDVWYSRLRMRFTAGYTNRRGIAAVYAAS
jgi:hypothetical protein